MKNHMDDGNRGTPMTEIDAWCLTDPVKKGPRADNCEKFAYRSTALYISWILKKNIFFEVVHIKQHQATNLACGDPGDVQGVKKYRFRTVTYQNRKTLEQCESLPQYIYIYVLYIYVYIYSWMDMEQTWKS